MTDDYFKSEIANSVIHVTQHHGTPAQRDYNAELADIERYRKELDAVDADDGKIFVEIVQMIRAGDDSSKVQDRIWDLIYRAARNERARVNGATWLRARYDATTPYIAARGLEYARDHFVDVETPAVLKGATS